MSWHMWKICAYNVFYYFLTIDLISKILDIYYFKNWLWAPVCFKQSKTVFDTTVNEA